MNSYMVTIYNGSDVLVYCNTFKAENENMAIASLLDTITLYSGDTIKVEEV